MQLPLFAERGLDLSTFHRATINLSIAPRVLMPLEPRVTFRGVRWHPTAPPEDFSFFDCRIGSVPNHLTPALVYRPHPETKPRHLQPPTVVEILAPFLPGVGVGRTLWLWVDPGQAALVEVTLDR